MDKRWPVTAAVALVVALVIVVYVVARPDPIAEVPGGPVGLTPLADGGFLFGDSSGGALYRVDGEGNVLSEPIARVDSQELIGIAVDPEERVFASWIDSEGTLAVGQVYPGAQRLVWRGPPSADHLGGSIAAAPDGSLAIAIGDLGDPDSITDRTASNGKVLSIDSNSSEDQRPLILSAGWIDPTGVAYLPNGELWVADGAAGVVARGDLSEPSSAAQVDGSVTALAATGPAELIACIGGDIVGYRIEEDGSARREESFGDGCDASLAALFDLSIVYASDDAIYEIPSASE